MGGSEKERKKKKRYAIMTSIGNSSCSHMCVRLGTFCREIITHLSTLIQHKCNMLAVEKYTSKLFQRSHTNGPNSHLK